MPEYYTTSQQQRTWLVLTALCQPAIMLIDHGHFQYNTVSLGLALWSFHYMTLGDSRTYSFYGPVIGSVLFSLALNFKQMELYHAPAVFAYLLGRCFREGSERRTTGAIQSTIRFFSLGGAVMCTFALLWAPFALTHRDSASSGANIDGVLQVLRRIFPFNRGIFEGKVCPSILLCLSQQYLKSCRKVANIWCALSVKPISIRNRLPQDMLPIAALGLTLLFILPICGMLFRAGERKQSVGGDLRILLWGTSGTALAFFLASFQVHEKGILIALAPLSMLALDAPRFVSFFSVAATWSLWPLLVIDRLQSPYFCSIMIYLCIERLMKVQILSTDNDECIIKFLAPVSVVVMVVLHLLEFLVDPPQSLPDLYPVLWSIVGCGLFSLLYLMILAAVWALSQQQDCSKIRKGGRNTVGVSATLAMSLSLLLLSMPEPSAPFVTMSQSEGSILTANTLQMAESVPDLELTRSLLSRAAEPLPWEVALANEATPVLDLSSARDLGSTLSLAEGAEEGRSDEKPAKEFHSDEGEPWMDGTLWKSTEVALSSLGIGDTRQVLDRAPQLLRLPTEQVVQAAAFVIDFCDDSTELIRLDPTLLCYDVLDLEHGLGQYLPNMMFRGNATQAAASVRTQLALSPTMALAVVKMGIEGGMEERRVSRALGRAGLASGKAAQSIVHETGRTYRDFKKIKEGKSPLG